MPGGSCERQKISDRFHHAVNLESSQLCVDRDAEDFIGKLVSYLAVATTEIIRVGKTFLLIHRERIINLATNAVGEQMRLQSIALPAPRTRIVYWFQMGKLCAYATGSTIAASLSSSHCRWESTHLQ